MYTSATGKGAETLDGYNFQVNFCGKKIACAISKEALQDVDPSNRMATSEQQFISNQAHFVRLAEIAILAALPITLKIA